MSRSRTTVTATATALTLGLGLGLTACGDGSDTGAEQAGTGSPGTGGTRVVTTERGDVEIPADPQRVAVVDWQLPTAMVDLGVTPVAIYAGYYDQDNAIAGVPETYVEALAEADRFGTWDALNLDAVLGADPDLIITTGTTLEDSQIAQLEEIAPVAHLSAEEGWQPMQERLAEVLGREDEYDALEEAFTQRAEDVATEHADLLAAAQWVPVSGGMDGEWFIEGGRTPTGSLLDTVGAQFAEVVDAEGYWSEPRSYETIGDLAEADIVLYAATPEGEPNSQTAPLLEHRLFTGLPAAESGNVFPFTQGGVSSLQWATDALDEVDRILDQAELR